MKCCWILLLTSVVIVQLAVAQNDSGLEYKPVYGWVTDNISVTVKNTLSDTIPFALAPGAPTVGTGQGVMWQPSFTVGYKLSLQNSTLKNHYSKEAWYKYVKPYEVGYSWGLGPSAKSGIPVGTSPWVLTSWQRQSTFYVQGIFAGDNVREMLTKKPKMTTAVPDPSLKDVQAQLRQKDAIIRDLLERVSKLEDVSKRQPRTAEVSTRQ